MTFQPRHSLFGTRYDLSCRLVRASNHDHRQTKLACGFDLGIGGRTTGILRDEDVNVLVAQQLDLGRTIERPARPEKAQAGRQIGSVRRVDHPREIVMLGSDGEGMQLLPSQAEEHAPGCRAEGLRSFQGVVRRLPAVAKSFRPAGTKKRGERDARFLAGSHRVCGNPRGIGMRGIDDGADRLPAKEVNEAGNAPESADSRRQRLTPGSRRSSSQRKNGVEASVSGQKMRQRGCFSGAAENQDAKSHSHGA